MSTTTAASPTKVVGGPFRASYLHVWEGKKNDKGEVKYQASLIWPKSDKALTAKMAAAQKAALEEGKTKWGGKVGEPKLPIRDGDVARADDEAYAGCWFVNASSNTRPGVLDIDKNEMLDKSLLYSGCFIKVSVNFYPFNYEGKKGIAVGLNNILKVKDGKPLAGRASAESDFKDEEIGEIEEDPFA